MTRETAAPLSRPLPLRRITPGGLDAEVEATEAERSALAADLDLPAIHALLGRYRVTMLPDRVRVTGRLRARVEQVCVVSLDPFETEIDEEVEVEFQLPDPRRPRREPAGEIELDPDAVPLDELAGDRVDLGAVTAEFLALGLDPYPRKPGAVFEPPAAPVEPPGPFAQLAPRRSGPEKG